MESLKSDPANPRALYSYASLYYAADDLETAEELLVRAVASDAGYSPPSRRSPASGPAAATTATRSTTSKKR